MKTNYRRYEYGSPSIFERWNLEGGVKNVIHVEFPKKDIGESGSGWYSHYFLEDHNLKKKFIAMIQTRDSFHDDFGTSRHLRLQELKNAPQIPEIPSKIEYSILPREYGVMASSELSCLVFNIDPLLIGEPQNLEDNRYYPGDKLWIPAYEGYKNLIKITEELLHSEIVRHVRYQLGSQSFEKERDDVIREEDIDRNLMRIVKRRQNPKPVRIENLEENEKYLQKMELLSQVCI